MQQLPFHALKTTRSQDKWRNLNMEARERDMAMVETDDDPDFRVSVGVCLSRSPGVSHHVSECTPHAVPPLEARLKPAEFTTASKLDLACLDSICVHGLSEESSEPHMPYSQQSAGLRYSCATSLQHKAGFCVNRPSGDHACLLVLSERSR